MAAPTTPSPLRPPSATARPPRASATAAADAIEVAGVRISSPGRVVYPESGVTKGEVAAYYAAVADWILPQVARRPLSLVRCPSGPGDDCFFQKHHALKLGSQVRAIPLRQKSGVEDYLYVEDAVGLLQLVQMNVLEFHPWGACIQAPEQPDMVVFDLDPGDGVAWKTLVAAAREIRRRLQALGLDSFVRLSGGKGLHVVMPMQPGPGWDETKAFAGDVAQALADDQPERYVATMSKARREGRIFIDWFRNARGATSVAGWSLRARPGAPVAMPLRWEELGRIARPDAFDLRKALRRAATLKTDPWAGFFACRQSLAAGAASPAARAG